MKTSPRLGNPGRPCVGTLRSQPIYQRGTRRKSVSFHVIAICILCAGRSCHAVCKARRRPADGWAAARLVRWRAGMRCSWLGDLAAQECEYLFVLSVRMKVFKGTAVGSAPSSPPAQPNELRTLLNISWHPPPAPTNPSRRLVCPGRVSRSGTKRIRNHGERHVVLQGRLHRVQHKDEAALRGCGCAHRSRACSRSR
jgi:hypothetical protein